LLIIGDALLLCLFSYMSYLMFGKSDLYSYMQQPIGELNL